MKILLDENLPQNLRKQIPGHDVFTIGFLGWKGVENGKLLRRAADEGFEVLLSSDRGIEYEHDIDNLPISVIILRGRTNDEADLQPLIPKLVEMLKIIRPRTLVRIES